MDFFDWLKEKKIFILYGSLGVNVLLLIATFFFLFQYLNYECVCPNDDALNKTLTYEDESKDYFVEIKGAVKNPNVYKVKSTNIINDVILMAGGFNEDAYTDNINLSHKVSDELVVYVYTKTEYKAQKTSAKTNNSPTKCECPTYDISSCTENKNSEIVVNYGVSSSNENSSVNNDTNNNTNTFDTSTNNETNKLVNINTASKNELMTLKGIGEAKAEKIIEYRNQNGIFKKIEDIKNVSGIGDAMFEKIKDSITV